MLWSNLYISGGKKIQKNKVLVVIVDKQRALTMKVSVVKLTKGGDMVSFFVKNETEFIERKELTTEMFLFHIQLFLNSANCNNNNNMCPPD